MPAQPHTRRRRQAMPHPRRDDGLPSSGGTGGSGSAYLRLRRAAVDLGVPLIEGRFFTDDDDEPEHGVAIVDERLALGGLRLAAMLNDAVSRVSSRTRYLLFLDCGIEATEDGWLERMRSIANRADVGAVGATLLNRSGTIEHAGVIVGQELGSQGGGFEARVWIDGTVSACRTWSCSFKLSIRPFISSSFCAGSAGGDAASCARTVTGAAVAAASSPRVRQRANFVTETSVRMPEPQHELVPRAHSDFIRAQS